MNAYVLKVLIFCTFLAVNISEETNSTKIRVKRHEDEKWYWGYYEETESEKTNEPTTEINPCLDKTYTPKPDFTAPGRRISDIKCYEYLWEIKHRDEVEKKWNDCIAYRMKNRGPNDPYFAIGGRDTQPGEFPHMGAIGWQAAVGTWKFMCGSSLISHKFVLTAAHCSESASRDSTVADPVPKIVRLGDKNILDKTVTGFVPVDKKIIRIISHPKYSAPKKYYDIALIEIEEVKEFTKYIQPACLWTRPDTKSLGTKSTLTGWGVIQSGTRNTSPELQAAVVDLIDSDTCDKLLRPSCNRHWCGIQEHQLCAGVLAGGVDACHGDSGGPLQMKIGLPTTSQGSIHYIIGVTSFGSIKCALPNLPGVYTRVSSFMDWIESIVWG